MKTHEFFRALRFIEAESPQQKWPHDILPGTSIATDGVVDETVFVPSEDAWNAIGYNPPGLAAARFAEADDSLDIRPRPTWAEISDANGKSGMIGIRDVLLNEVLAREESRRICVAYIGDQHVRQTVEQEILYRLRASADDLAIKDAERDRLHGKAIGLRGWVEHADRTLAELEGFDPTADSHWAAPADDSEED